MRRNRFKPAAPRDRRTAGQIGNLLLRALLGLTLLTGLSLVLLLGHDILTQTRRFELRHLEIGGLKHLTEAEIRTWAGLDMAPNILGLNCRLLAKRLAAHPWLASARVQRNWPDGLTLTLTEHDPLAVVQLPVETDHQAREALFVLNAAGVLFKEYESHDPQDLPLVKGMRIQDCTRQEGEASVGFQSLMTLLELLQASGEIHRDMLARIEIDPDLGLAITFKPAPNIPEASRILLGFHDYARKLRLLQRVLHYAGSQEQGLYWLDLQNPLRLTARFKTMQRPDTLDTHGS